MGSNMRGLIHAFLSLVNTTVAHDLRLVESIDTEGRLLIISGFSTGQRVGAPNACVV